MVCVSGENYKGRRYVTENDNLRDTSVGLRVAAN